MGMMAMVMSGRIGDLGLLSSPWMNLPVAGRPSRIFSLDVPRAGRMMI